MVFRGPYCLQANTLSPVLLLQLPKVTFIDLNFNKPICICVVINNMKYMCLYLKKVNGAMNEKIRTLVEERSLVMGLVWEHFTRDGISVGTFND